MQTSSVKTSHIREITTDTLVTSSWTFTEISFEDHSLTKLGGEKLLHINGIYIYFCACQVWKEFLKETVAAKPSSGLQSAGRDENLTSVVFLGEMLSSDFVHFQTSIAKATSITSSAQAEFLKGTDIKD